MHAAGFVALCLAARPGSHGGEARSRLKKKGPGAQGMRKEPFFFLPSGSTSSTCTCIEVTVVCTPQSKKIARHLLSDSLPVSLRTRAVGGGQASHPTFRAAFWANAKTVAVKSESAEAFKDGGSHQPAERDLSFACVVLRILLPTNARDHGLYDSRILCAPGRGKLWLCIFTAPLPESTFFRRTKNQCSTSP